MNKILSILIGLLSLLFVSCMESDKSFIKKIKHMKNKNGETVEQLIDNYIVAAEFLQANKNSNIEKNISSVALKIQEANNSKLDGNKEQINELSKLLATYHINYPEIKNINWKIISNSKAAKLIEVASDNIYLKLPIYKTKVNTAISFSNIEVYTTSNQPIDLNKLNAAHEVIEFIANENILE